MRDKKRTRLPWWPTLLLLGACASSPPPAAKLPPPAADLMNPRQESYLTELEKILSRLPSERMPKSARSAASSSTYGR